MVGEALVRAMLAWADRNSRKVDTRVPIIALLRDYEHRLADRI